MKSLLAAIAFAAVALPGAAFAAEGIEKCCCCEKMGAEGADCCDKHKDRDKGTNGGHAGHGEHAAPTLSQPSAPAN